MGERCACPLAGTGLKMGASCGASARSGRVPHLDKGL